MRYLFQLFRQGRKNRPPVVCLCGSTRFKSLFEAANRRLTLEGNVVLSVGFYGHVDGMPSPDEKRRLDRLHLEKVRMADLVVLVSPVMSGGEPYIGESTANELNFAEREGKSVVWYTGEGYMDL